MHGANCHFTWLKSLFLLCFLKLMYYIKAGDTCTKTHNPDLCVSKYLLYWQQSVCTRGGKSRVLCQMYFLLGFLSQYEYDIFFLRIWAKANTIQIHAFLILVLNTIVFSIFFKQLFKTRAQYNTIILMIIQLCSLRNYGNKCINYSFDQS